MKHVAPDRTRLKACVRGAVQGVGFRPFVYRLATGLGLAGWVNNSPQGVFIQVEGPRAALEQFLLRLEAERPPRSFIQSLEATWLDAVGYSGFEIRESQTDGGKTVVVLPDIATCPDCLREIFDPANRRYHYPFTNCTNCGPRFSIIEALPYDRANTSMKGFAMCPACQAEYDDPPDRRFHAQPNACPACGPEIELWAGRHQANPATDQRQPPRAQQRGYQALLAAADAIRDGKIVAVKGLGGFHLMVAARDEMAVRSLRERKHREEKPLALMFPSLASAEAICEISRPEERLLRSPESPIVLLRRRVGGMASDLKSKISPAVAPGNPCLGVMLPYTPLHHLLLAELGFPVVATSGNLSDEPICTDEIEALARLGAIADIFLVHNRPIVRHVDDSVARVMLGRELVLRRARGYAPMPVALKGETVNRKPSVVLGVGAHLKNTIALAVGPQVFISQHIGDLETEQSYAAFRRVIADFEKLYEATPDKIAADLHPDYLSTKFASEQAPGSDVGSSGSPKSRTSHEAHGSAGPRCTRIQHHLAHVWSCMADNELEPSVLGVSWDGTGYGLDGTVWGGEFFLVTRDAAERVGHLRPFRLPGGGQAVKEPRRAALGLLHELSGTRAKSGAAKPNPVAGAFTPEELAALNTMLMRALNSPWCSSVGRLFDAVASLLGLCQQVRFEGQAAMELEFALEGVNTDQAYPLPVIESAALPSVPKTGPPLAASILDWSEMIGAILRDAEQRLPPGAVSARFHNALAEGIVRMARRVGQRRVVLSGGCFQNRYLTERTVGRLWAEGFQPYWHQRVPPNDGGISLGQVVAARRQTG